MPSPKVFLTPCNNSSVFLQRLPGWPLYLTVHFSSNLYAPQGMWGYVRCVWGCCRESLWLCMWNDYGRNPSSWVSTSGVAALCLSLTSSQMISLFIIHFISSSSAHWRDWEFCIFYDYSDILIQFVFLQGAVSSYPLLIRTLVFSALKSPLLGISVAW